MKLSACETSHTQIKERILEATEKVCPPPHTHQKDTFVHLSEHACVCEKFAGAVTCAQAPDCRKFVPLHGLPYNSIKRQIH